MGNQVFGITIKADGSSQVITEVNKASAGFSSLKSTIDNTSQSLDKNASQSKSFNTELENMLRRLDPVYKATQNLNDGFSLLQKGLASGQVSTVTYLRSLEALKDESLNVVDATTRAARGIKQVNDASQNGQENVNGLGAAFRNAAPYLVAFFAVDRVIDFGKAVVESGIQAQKFIATMTFATGSATKAADSFAYIKKLSADLGLELSSSAKAFAQFSASAQGTGLEGQKTRDIFESVSKAAVIMGLSAEETQGSFYALGQMISKGTVQSEELRGQLGDRMPGAFNIAARAMGVTTVELGNMLQAGQVLSEDFLPKFANELNKTLSASGDSASSKAQKSLSQLSTAWTEFKQAIAEAGVIKITVIGADTATAAIKGVTGLVGPRTSSQADQKYRLDSLLQQQEANKGLLGFLIPQETKNAIVSEINQLRINLGIINKQSLQPSTGVTYGADVLPLALSGRAGIIDDSKRKGGYDTRENEDIAKRTKATKTEADTIAEKIKVLKIENDLIANGVSVSDAKVIADLKVKGVSDSLITTYLNLNAEQRRKVDLDKESEKLAKEQADNLAKSLKSIDDLTASTQKEANSTQQKIDLLTIGAVKMHENELATLDQTIANGELVKSQLIAAKASQQYIDYIDSETEAYKRLRSAKAEAASKNEELGRLQASQKAAEDAQKAIEKTQAEATKAADNINRSLADAILRGFERGETIAQNFRNTLVNMFKTLILQPTISYLLSPVSNLISGITSGSLAGSGGATGGLSSVVSGGKNLFDAISTGNFSITSSIEKLGVLISNGNGGIADAIGGFLGKNAGSISSALPYVGAALQLLTGDAQGAAFTAGGAAIGSIIPGVGTVVGAAIGSLIGGLFGDSPSYQNVNEKATYKNGVFSQGALSNNSRGPIANGAVPTLNAVGQQFGDSVGALLKAFGQDTAQNQSFQVKFGKQLEAVFTYQLANGKSATIGKWGTNYGDTSEAAMKAFVEDILSKGIVSAIGNSNLTEGVKSLFNGLTDSTSVSNMLNATIALQTAQDKLSNSFNLSVDAAAKVAKTQSDVIGTINSILSAASALQTVGDQILASKAALKTALGADILPSSLEAFDNLLKQIDTTTSAGIDKFASLFSVRAAFSAYQGAIDGLKTNTAASLLDFRSPQDKASALQTALDAQFAKFNITTPKTVQELINLGDSIDYTTKNGLDLAAAFPSLVSAFKTTQEAIDATTASLTVNSSKFKTAAEFDYYQAVQRNYGTAVANAKALPSYDIGSSYVPADMTANIHQGERIFTAVENRQIIDALNSPDQNMALLVQVIQALRDELEQLRSENTIQNEQLILNTYKTQSLLDKFDKLGLLTKVAA